VKRIQHLEAFRFHVRSKSRKDVWHLVDLEERNGMGECSCEQFQFRCTTALKEGKTDESTVCEHLDLVYRVFGRWVVKKVVKERTMVCEGRG